jgi:D-threo-aldose 1-dehydrogenase
MFAASFVRSFVTRRGKALPFTTLGFGSAPLGNFPNALTEEACDATVAQAWARGLRFFDTAPLYGLGLSEQRIGRILRQHPRNDYLLATKVGRLLEPCAPGQSNAGIFVDAPQMRYVYDYSYDGVRRACGGSASPKSISCSCTTSMDRRMAGARVPKRASRN